MRAAAVLLVLTLALAGCTSSDNSSNDPDPQPDDPGGNGGPGGQVEQPPPEPITELPLLTGFDIEGCTGFTHLSSHEPAAVQTILPDGYTPRTDLGISSIALPRALLATDWLSCEGFTAVGIPFEDVYFGRLYTIIEPPERHAAAVDGLHEYIFAMLAAEDILGTLWAAAGFETSIGAPTLENQLALWSGDVAGYSWTGSAVGTPLLNQQYAGPFAWYHETEKGDTLVWTGEAIGEPAIIGAGQMIVPNDSPIASLAQPVVGFATQFEQRTNHGFEEMELTLKLLEPI